MEDKKEKQIIYQHAYETLINKDEDMRLSAKGLASKGDEDLIIEGNSVYEIDRKCCDKNGRGGTRY